MRVKPVFVSSASSNNPSSEVEWFIIPSCLKSEAVLDTDYTDSSDLRGQVEAGIILTAVTTVQISDLTVVLVFCLCP